MPRKNPQPRQRSLDSQSQKDFEDLTTATLREQDRILARVEQKLEAPVLNGGFEDLTRKVDKIDSVQETSAKQLKEIHTTIYHPEEGIYVTVSQQKKWIKNVNNALTWVLGLLAAGVLTATGKILYDVFAGHIKFIN